ncbi:hypothetical protein [Reyranella sp.]|uniref:hypothetical protein n=1 Tax=Reyranella sp. TaxID=1929291 RepID=UPI003BA95D14
MKIDDDHMYHGAALIQIAEHPEFTAINSAKLKGVVQENTFQVNQSVAIHLKYASKPNKAHSEYVFTFHKHHLQMLKALEQKSDKVFIGLVCVEARQICCISHRELEDLIATREAKKGAPEDQYTLLVTVPSGKQFRVYMNAPGQKKTSIGSFTVPRNAFPGCIFS